MLNILKRYTKALIFLSVIILLMLIATYGVKVLGDRMSDEMGIKITPRGEKINK